MKRFSLLAALLVLTAIALPAGAHAAIITFSGSASGRLDTGTNAVFNDTVLGATLNVVCTAHDARATSVNLSTLNSVNTSVRLLAAENSYTGCTYTTNIASPNSGNATVRVRCDWILTAVTTTSGTISITTDRCVQIDLTTGGLAGAQIFVDRQDVRVTTATPVTPGDRRPAVSITANRAAVNYTATGIPLIRSGTADQTERLTISTASLS